MVIKNITLWNEILQYLELKYPERHDFQYNSNEDMSELIIHYPEIEMINTAGKKHIITDLFVKIYFKDENGYRIVYYDKSIQGMRMSASEAELIGQYKHSHLPRANPQRFNNFSRFCLGHGPLPQHLQKCAAYTYSIVDFKLLMLNLDTYVAYESTDTSPYIRFTGLSGSNRVSNSISQLSDIRTYVSKIDNPQNIKIMCKNDRAIVKNIGELSTLAYNNVSAVFPRYNLSSLSSDGKYWGLSDGNYNLNRYRSEILNQEFVFRGKVMKFRITDQDVQKTIVIHPDIQIEIKKYIENELNYTTWLEGLVNSKS